MNSQAEALFGYPHAELEGQPLEVLLPERSPAARVLHREPQEALLSIQDQGIGIPQAEQAHLFGRFARASNGERYGISGTGLGLSLCRELVEQHGGRIWFESTEGAGSTFFLRLPLVQHTSSRSGAERPPSSEGSQ